MTIAIDGPSGAGKSTIAKILSQKLGAAYLDTGAMYRAVGLKVHRLNIRPDDEKRIIPLLDTIKIDIIYKDGAQKVLLDGEDVSSAIREHHISSYASDVSKIQAVRLKMVDLQRIIASKSDTVLDGRDIGTYVLPNAEFKFFLTASVQERAKRRHLELCQKGEKCKLCDIERDIAARDHNDCTRDFAPLKKAEDAVEIDSTNFTIDQVVNIMLNHIKNKAVNA